MMTELITRKVLQVSYDWQTDPFENKSQSRIKYRISLTVEDEAHTLFVLNSRPETLNALQSSDTIFVIYDKNSKRVFKLLIDTVELDV
jgi:hypothetical protein